MIDDLGNRGARLSPEPGRSPSIRYEGQGTSIRAASEQTDGLEGTSES